MREEKGEGEGGTGERGGEGRREWGGGGGGDRRYRSQDVLMFWLSMLCIQVLIT